jgi:hypothetical protein
MSSGGGMSLKVVAPFACATCSHMSFVMLQTLKRQFVDYCQLEWPVHLLFHTYIELAGLWQDEVLTVLFFGP